jgi:hypothetical protein
MTTTPDLLSILTEMTAPSPSARPSFADTLVQLRRVRKETSDEVLKQSVPRAYGAFYASHIKEEKWATSLKLGSTSS